MTMKKETMCYNTDSSRLIGKAENVIFPETIDQLKKIIKESNHDIVPRGTGVNCVGGTIPNNSLVTDVSKMNKVTTFSSQKKTVRAEAGITIKELNEKLNSVFFEFPIYSYDNGIRSLGGSIALNLPGDRTLRYGYTKDFIEEIELVNGSGELIKTNKVDLSDICGMEGITGIIVAATIKIIPLFERTISIYQTENIDDILSMNRRLKQENDVTMIKLIPKQVSRLLKLKEKYNLIIEFDSKRGKVNGEEYKKIIELLSTAYSCLYSEGYYNSEDSKLFSDKIKEFVSFLELNNIPYFGDLGIGIIYSFFKDDEKFKWNATINILKKIKSKPGRYGIGLTRKYLLDSFERKIIARVKEKYDPRYKINKNKVIDLNAIEYINTINETKNEKLIYKKSNTDQRDKGDVLKSQEESFESSLIENSDNYVTSKSEFSNKTISKKGDLIKEIVYNTNNLVNYSKSSKENLEKIDNQDLKNVPEKKGKISENEKDIINKILGNKYAKDSKEDIN
jgi:hypothetical protein